MNFLKFDALFKARLLLILSFKVSCVIDGRNTSVIIYGITEKGPKTIIYLLDTSLFFLGGIIIE